MKFGFSNKSTRNCLLVRANIVIGLVLSVIGIIAIMFGSYDNLAARQTSESLLNALAVGGLVYAAVFWMIKSLGLPCRMREREE